MTDVDFRRAVSIELTEVDRHTRWNGSGVDERDYLTAAGSTQNLEAFDRETGDRRAIERLDVWVERVPVPEIEALLRLVIDRSASPPVWRAELYVRVPGPLYRELVTAAGGVGRIAIASRLPSREGAVEMAVGARAGKVLLEDVVITAERPLASATAASAAADAANMPSEQVLARVLVQAIPGGRAANSMLWQIGLELVRSIATRASRMPTTDHTRVGHDIGSLIVAVGDAFRARGAALAQEANARRIAGRLEPEPDGEAPAPLLAEFADGRADGRGDPLWSHLPAAALAAGGQASAPLPTVDGLEALAARYCGDERLTSPTLEWALVDALLGHATRSIALDTPQPATARPALVARAKRLGIEALWIGATAWIALLLAAPNYTVFWIIFLGVTALRWLRMRGTSNAGEALREAGALAQDMRAAYDRLTEVAFNAGQLRSLLYALEARGVVVNPWVYHLLDKRIRRAGEV